MIPDTLYLNLPLFILGLLIIIKGSDLFLDNAVWIARASGISQIVIGATIVSFCTTLPEMVSSCTAAFRGSADMALGNAIGSVICNTGVVLAIVLLFCVVRIRREVFLIKGAFMIGALVISLVLIWPGPGETVFRLSRLEGFVLIVFLGIFLVVNYYESLHIQKEPGSVQSLDGPAPEPGVVTRRELLRRLAFFLAGAVAVTVGAYLLVEFGQRLARNIGVSEAVISLLFVALGTSLPELFTAISAIRRNAEGISVGNIYGANVLNMALVVGSAALIRPLEPQDQNLPRFDIPVALLICTVSFIFGLCRGSMGKKTGFSLLALYAAYLVSMFVMGRIG